MTVLGIDTATAVSTVGVVRDARVVAEVVERSRTGHAAGLPALVRRALDQASARIEDLNGLAVSIGPGSFTGLRVGLSFAKGVAFASGTKIVGVSTLEALAVAVPAEFLTIAVACDARRGEVYLAMFRRTQGRVEREGEDVALPPGLAAQRIRVGLGGQPRPIVVGDAAERYPEAFTGLASEAIVIASFAEIHPRGSVVALLGEKRLAAGDAHRLDTLVPFYVRPSAAEGNLRIRSLTTENRLS